MDCKINFFVYYYLNFGRQNIYIYITRHKKRNIFPNNDDEHADETYFDCFHCQIIKKSLKI